MKRKLIAFDLDDTLAITKSPISDRMRVLLIRLLEKYEVCIISGGRFEQFQLQVLDCLEGADSRLAGMHMMPTCGTRYYRYDELSSRWALQYAEDLSESQKRRIAEALEASAREVGAWEINPYGLVIEDRGSQVTYSALGQQAPAEKKYEWAKNNRDLKIKLRELAARKLPDLGVRLGGTTSVDVTRRGIDKAYGMRKLMDLCNLNREDVLFIGDKLQEGGNDYPVKAMGIDTIEVDGWEDTAFVIEGILAAS